MMGTPSNESWEETFGKASRRAAALSLAGFLLVVGAMFYAFASLRRLEQERANLETTNARLRVEVAKGARQRDSLYSTVSQMRGALDATRSAINAFHAGRLEDAVRLYGDAIRADPGNPYVRNLQAYALFRLGRIPEAISAQRRTLAVDSSYAWGYVDLARFLCASSPDSLPAARAATEHAIALQPELTQKMRGDGEFRRVCRAQLP
jgi:tetratricopeptide (TPR) repeat protein